MPQSQISPTGKRFCREYCRRLRRSLRDLPDLRRRMVRQSRESILAYLEAHPAATEEELYDSFGLPEAVAMTTLATMEPEELHRRMRRHRLRRLAISFLLIAAFLYAIASCVRLEITYLNDDSYGVIGPAIVMDGPIPTNPPD